MRFKTICFKDQAIVGNMKEELEMKRTIVKRGLLGLPLGIAMVHQNCRPVQESYPRLY